MRILTSYLLISGLGFAQNFTEFGAAAAGSAVGSAGGKPLSNGISTIYGKTGQQAAKAAGKEGKGGNELQAGVLKVAPGAPRADPSGVPPPPPPARKRDPHVSPAVERYVVPEEVARISSWADVAPTLPPPPVMSPEELRRVSTGMMRADVLSLGAPSSKITTFEDGHLVEIYSYYQNGQRFGGLKLTDGMVSSIPH